MSDHGLALAAGSYPERPERSTSMLDRLAGWPVFLCGTLLSQRAWKRSQRAMAAHVYESTRLEDRDFASDARAIRYQLRKDGLNGVAVDRALALCSDVVARLFDDRLEFADLAAARCILHGKVVEHSGGRKPRVVAIAAAIAALAGFRVHVMFSTGVGAKRESEAARELFAALGVTQASVEAGLDETKRRSAYACDVVYACYREIAFDYLRDRIAFKSQPRIGQRGIEVLTGGSATGSRAMLRGLHFAILMEADAILLDESHTPLTLAADASKGQEQRWLSAAITAARELSHDIHFEFAAQCSVKLTEAGRSRLAEVAPSLGTLWAGTHRREHIVSLALVALNLRCDDEYRVNSGVLELSDPKYMGFGLDASDRDTLRQLIEIKEGCRMSSGREQLASLSCQRFYRRYLKMGGMTTCARGARAELWSMFGLVVVSAAQARRKPRTPLAPQVFATERDKWDALMKSAVKAQEQGCAVVVCTRTPMAAREFAELLDQSQIPHQLLVGSQDENESAAFAHAAMPRQITVTVSWAARSATVAPTGGANHSGMRVFIAQALESARHEQQFVARCEVSGLGTVVHYSWSLEDELIAAYAPVVATALLRAMGEGSASLMRKGTLRYAQWRAGMAAKQYRREMLGVENYVGDMMSCSGPRV
ncbi:MAG: hypothetical protein ABI612_05620 [Betaproteobacteria bacterium]